jgi:predicted enzyme related to lactoylglutathione lyase
MSQRSHRAPGQHPAHGQMGYLELPALEVAASAAFYASVFGWKVDADQAGFEAPGMIGQWTTEWKPSSGSGPVIWICVDQLYPTLELVQQAGGRVRQQPELDHGERWLVRVEDPAGNLIGLVAPVGTPQPQTMLAVRDVEAASRWYQRVLGLTSAHGGPHYERLLSGGTLVMQLHQRSVEHHHGVFTDPDAAVGNGVLVWFGDVSDFDGVVTRVRELAAPIVREPHRNPPEGGGNGPGHREIWVQDPDGYTVVIASPDGEAFQPEP